jgi:flagellar biogenesis protein FliO
LDILSLLFSLCGVVFVIFLAYWGTRWLSIKYKAVSNGKYIKILERTMVSKDMYFVLVQISEKIYLLSVTGQHTETICTIDASEIDIKDDSETKGDFSSIFMELLKKQVPFIDKIKLGNVIHRGKKL